MLADVQKICINMGRQMRKLNSLSDYTHISTNCQGDESFDIHHVYRALLGHYCDARRSDEDPRKDKLGRSHPSWRWSTSPSSSSWRWLHSSWRWGGLRQTPSWKLWRLSTGVHPPWKSAPVSPWLWTQMVRWGLPLERRIVWVEDVRCIK